MLCCSIVFAHNFENNLVFLFPFALAPLFIGKLQALLFGKNSSEMLKWPIYCVSYLFYARLVISLIWRHDLLVIYIDLRQSCICFWQILLLLRFDVCSFMLHTFCSFFSRLFFLAKLFQGILVCSSSDSDFEQAGVWKNGVCSRDDSR